MSVFQSLVKKEALHLLRDFRTIIVVLVMPVVLLLLFGFAISTEVNNVSVATVVEQHTDQTKQIIDRFRANPYFTFEGVVAYSDVEDLLREGKVDAAVVFRTRDGKLEHQVVVDASNTIMAQTATAYLESVISPGADTPIVTSTLYNPRLKSAYNFVPGIMGMIFILICAMMTSVSIVREKETGTMDLLLVSPVRPWTIVFGKLVPYFLLSCVILALTLVLSYTVLGYSGADARVELHGARHTFLFSPLRRDMGNHSVCDSCPCLGIAHLHHCLHASGGLAHIWRDVHDSGHLAVGHDIPRGEHAVGSPMDLVCYPRPLVYLGHASLDDSAVARGLCVDGSPCPGRDDIAGLGIGHQEV